VKAVIQRVSRASVEVDGRTVGAIERGLLVLLGVAKGDDDAAAAKLADKVATYRVFEDDAGKMNLSVRDVGGGVLVISQFTICADCRKGRRPSFDPAAPPDEAERLYAVFVDHLKASGLQVQTGVFGAMMDVHLVNQGPVTFILET